MTTNITKDRNSTNGTTNMQSAPGFAAFRADTQLSFVQAYDPKASPITDYTQHVIRYRDTKGTASKPAKMVFLPVVVLPEYVAESITEADSDSLKPGEPIITPASGYGFIPEQARKVLIGAIEDAQSDLVRAMIDDGKSVVEWSDVTLDKALDYLTAARTSFRLTKEGVVAWAQIALKEVCYKRAKLISKEKQHDEEKAEAQRNGTLARYVDETSKLSAAVPNLGMETAKAVSIMLEAANVDDDIAKLLKKKLHAILNPQFDANGL